jgi:hypothetical protein
MGVPASGVDDRRLPRILRDRDLRTADDPGLRGAIALSTGGRRDEQGDGREGSQHRQSRRPPH